MFHVKNLAVDLKKMPLGILQTRISLNSKLAKRQNFVYAIPFTKTGKNTKL